LQAESIDAWDYVNAINHQTWARYDFPMPRYGVDTNNIIESLNSVWADIRRLPPLQMMDEIYTFCMRKVYNRFHRPQ
jgi:hypothetical protein